MPNESPKPNMADDRVLKTAHSQINVALVFGPISLFLGGMLLGIIGIILAVLGLRKLNGLIEKNSVYSADAERLKKSARIALIVCGIAIALNFASFVIMYPTIMEMIDSGQLDALLGSSGAVGSGSSAGSSATSTWG